MKRLPSLSLGLFGGLVLVTYSDVGHAAKKVAVCHRPPGDPGNPHTIAIAEDATTAHLKHGDQLGECPSGCAQNASLCDDENRCTADVCLPSGQCEHTVVDCDDGNPCTNDVCDQASGCLNPAANGIACDDGNECTTADTCRETVCRGDSVPGCCSTDAQCDDGNLCTADRCVGDACQNHLRDCSVADKCLAGFCDPATGNCGTTPVTCNDSNACTQDLCNSATGCFFCPTDGCCTATTETCDYRDNDCDGMIDEGFDVGTPCSAGIGACFRPGVRLCSPDGTTTQCSAQPGSPSSEVCDQADNDCDGMIDEGFDVGTPCSAGIGACFRPGFRLCSPDGTGTQCSALPASPSPEVCDYRDNDCDGEIDEGFDVGTPCSAGIGACFRPGVRVCSSDGTGTQCNAQPGSPSPEVCDHVDNDCDGEVDEVPECNPAP